ncbi:MAG: PorV/PorQ family protein [Elusimicrobia bacterium]|nr:PorV/PorQ family protein [Elusimicrobiota bacterium]
MKNKLSTILVLTIVLIAIYFCDFIFPSAPGSTAANFLKIGVGARATGMGEAAVGVCDDVNSIYWNPAGLGTISNAESSFLYTKWLADMSYQYFLNAYPVKSDGLPNQTLGLAIYNFTYGDIQGADYEGLKTKNLRAGDLAICISDGIKLDDVIDLKNFYAGLSVKYIGETLDNKKASAFAGDAGIFNKQNLLNGEMGFGLSVRNVGSGLKFVSESYPLPMNISFGTSYKRNLFGLEDPLTLAVDVNYPNDNKFYFNGGAEYWIINLIGVRVGYKTGQDIGSGIRAGVGLKMNIFQIDVAYAGYDKLGDTYRLGMTLKFGKPTKLRVTTMPVSTGEVDSLLKSAEKLYNDGRFAEAILEYSKVLHLDATNKSAIECMRKCNEKLKTRD